MEKWTLRCFFSLKPDKKRTLIQELSALNPNPFKLTFSLDSYSADVYFEIEAPDNFQAHIKANEILSQIESIPSRKEGFELLKYEVAEKGNG